MNDSLRAFAMSVFLVCTASQGAAYDNIVTHPAMSREAFERADGARNILKRIGVSPESYIVGRRARDWVAAGARAEDDGHRPLNHFYDPIHDIPLETRLPSLLCQTIVPFSGKYTAAGWALYSTVTDNIHNLRAAKHALTQAMLSPYKADREKHLAEYLTTMGHLMHLVQDMSATTHAKRRSSNIRWCELFRRSGKGKR